MEPLSEQLLELIRLTSCELAPDIQRALEAARDREEGRSRSTVDWMVKNAAEAKVQSLPICQDTGSLIFSIEHGPDLRPMIISGAAHAAVAEATRRNLLRPNAVDSIDGRNSSNNLGIGSPQLYFHESEQPGALSVRLMLKGGGSENCGIQYSLPDRTLNAGRDVAGIKRCIADAVFKAQGFGCAPGTLGVGVGGDRGSSFLESKEQFFRSLDDRNPDPQLAALEQELLLLVNELGIGPMGFGGKTSVLGIKIGKRHRLPASFFVSVSYMCWAYRRRRMDVRDGVAHYS